MHTAKHLFVENPRSSINRAPDSFKSSYI